MPFYDRRCNLCGHTQIDVYEPVGAPNKPCPAKTHVEFEPDCNVQHADYPCGGTMERAWLSSAPGVIGDECDVVVRHGICNEDGSPRRYRFKSEMRAEAKRRGLVNTVEHIGAPGSDKSAHTTRWT